jgi:hypothetical protein
LVSLLAFAKKKLVFYQQEIDKSVYLTIEVAPQNLKARRRGLKDKQA